MRGGGFVKKLLSVFLAAAFLLQGRALCLLHEAEVHAPHENCGACMRDHGPEGPAWTSAAGHNHPVHDAAHCALCSSILRVDASRIGGAPEFLAPIVFCSSVPVVSLFSRYLEGVHLSRGPPLFVS